MEMYETPEMEIINFYAADIIRTSGMDEGEIPDLDL